MLFVIWKTPLFIPVQSTYAVFWSIYPPVTLFLMHLNAISFIIFHCASLWETRHSVSLVSNLLSSFPRERMTRIKDTTCGSSPLVFACSPIFFTRQRRKMFSEFLSSHSLLLLLLLPIFSFCLISRNVSPPGLSFFFYLLLIPPSTSIFVFWGCRMQKHSK